MSDDIKIHIATSADVAGAEKAKTAIADVNQEAEKGEGMSSMIRELAHAEHSFSLLERGSTRGVIGMTRVEGAAMGAGIGIAVFATAAEKLLSGLSEGANRAAEMAQGLEGLDEASRKAAVEGMGDLGQYIDASSESLMRFAADTEAASKKMGDLWTAAGARIVPILDETAASLAKINTADFGADIGDAIGGLLVYMKDFKEEVNSGNESWEEALKVELAWAKAITDHVPAQMLLNAILEKSIQRNKDYIASQQGLGLSEEQKNEIKARGADLDKALAAAAERRANAELPLAEQIAKAEEKKAEAQKKAASLPGKPGDQAGAEVLALDAQIAALQKKKDAEDAANQKKAEAAASTKADAEQQIHLKEEIAAGNKDGENKIRVEMAYQDALKKTGSLQEAIKSRNAEEKILNDKVAADRAKEAQEAVAAFDRQAEKDKLAADRKAKEAEALKAKHDELDIETRINEAKALGNNKEVARLEWLKQYNSLRGQKDAEGNSIYSEEEARRAANAKSATSGPVSNYVKPGELDNGTRRGRDESDMSWALSKANANMGGPGGSALDAYYAQGGGTAKTLPQPATPAGGGDAIAKAGDGLDKSGDKIDGAAGKVAAAVDRLGNNISGLKSKVDSTATKLEGVAAKVDALSNKV